MFKLVYQTGLRSQRYRIQKNNKNDKYSKDYFKIQVSIIQALYLYLERKKKGYNSNLI